MIISLNLPHDSYDITLECGALHRVGEILNLDRRVLIVTDSGVPAEYAQTVAAQCRDAAIVCIEQGEGSKNLDTFAHLCRQLLQHGFTRKDCVVAVGGGMVGDLAGFAAASFMRGIDFYNIPTTVLAQVDSSIGGKVAVDLDGIKNIVGAFYQPRGVVVDPDVLRSLPQRQIANGLAEAVKMALTFDAPLFELFEREDAHQHMEEIIAHSLRSKQAVVEQDEKEAGLRKVLNFGHTMGHAIESVEGLGGLYHGECVALGMLPLCSDEVRTRLISVLEKLYLPTHWSGDTAALCAAAAHDKKADGNSVTVVTVPRVGEFVMENWTAERLNARMEEYFS